MTTRSPLTASAAGGNPSSRSSVTSSQCQSATRDLAVSRLDDLGSFADCLIPDGGVRVGKGLLGGVEPGGNRGPEFPGGNRAVATARPWQPPDAGQGGTGAAWESLARWSVRAA